MKNKHKTTVHLPERLGKVGGQAVLEGVMMKAGSHTVTTCRREDGTLAVHDGGFTSVRSKHKILNLPLVRGVVNFAEMMKLSFSTLEVSASVLGVEEEESKFERWLKEKLHIDVTGLAMVLGVVLGLALAVGLFIFLPALLSGWIAGLCRWDMSDVSSRVWVSLIEGGCKIFIFLSYLWLVSLLPDIRRTFMYHGAEHKSIACFESGAELTPENAAECTRFHPRCGTSFMFVMILLGVFAGFFIRLIFPGIEALRFGKLLYALIRLAILPLVVGLGYEYIMYAGRHDNPLTRVLSAPGLWVQRLTTKEPTLPMLEVAIVSLKCALRDEYPEFRAFYDARGWEPAPAEPHTAAPAEQTPEPVQTAFLGVEDLFTADPATDVPAGKDVPMKDVSGENVPAADNVSAPETEISHAPAQNPAPDTGA